METLYQDIDLQYGSIGMAQNASKSEHMVRFCGKSAYAMSNAVYKNDDAVPGKVKSSCRYLGPLLNANGNNDAEVCHRGQCRLKLADVAGQ